MSTAKFHDWVEKLPEADEAEAVHLTAMMTMTVVAAEVETEVVAAVAGALPEETEAGVLMATMAAEEIVAAEEIQVAAETAPAGGTAATEVEAVPAEVETAAAADAAAIPTVVEAAIVADAAAIVEPAGDRAGKNQSQQVTGC